MRNATLSTLHNFKKWLTLVWQMMQTSEKMFLFSLSQPANNRIPVTPPLLLHLTWMPLSSEAFNSSTLCLYMSALKSNKPTKGGQGVKEGRGGARGYHHKNSALTQTSLEPMPIWKKSSLFQGGHRRGGWEASGLTHIYIRKHGGVHTQLIGLRQLLVHTSWEHWPLHPGGICLTHTWADWLQSVYEQESKEGLVITWPHTHF